MGEHIHMADGGNTRFTVRLNLLDLNYGRTWTVESLRQVLAPVIPGTSWFDWRREGDPLPITVTFTDMDGVTVGPLTVPISDTARRSMTVVQILGWTTGLPAGSPSVRDLERGVVDYTFNGEPFQLTEGSQRSLLPALVFGILVVLLPMLAVYLLARRFNRRLP